MKYGYLFYRKHLPKLRKERPINLGDPIQSLAVINLYKEMGINDEDIIPIDRYDMSNYKGENVIIVVNGIEGYEHYSYNTHALPPASDLTPIYFSYCLMREIDEDMKKNFCQYSPVGCRDIETLERMKKKGIDAYLTGCLTITLPKRQPTNEQTEIFFVDCPQKLKNYIPESIKETAIFLSSVIRFKSNSLDDRMTYDETINFHNMAKERLDLLRDRAKLVVTSRFHVALPSLAMGIPTIIAIDTADSRFEILEKFVDIYTYENYSKIDWSPTVIDLEKTKAIVKSAFFNAINFRNHRNALQELYPSKRDPNKYEYGVIKALKKITPLLAKGNFRFAVWGVCLVKTLQVCETILSINETNELVAGIDSYQAGEYMGKPIINPSLIKTLPQNICILVLAPSVISYAMDVLKDTGRSYAVFKGENVEFYNLNIYDSLGW